MPIRERRRAHAARLHLRVRRYRRLAPGHRPLGQRDEYSYDAEGDQLSETLPDGETTQNVYNSLGQLYPRIDFDGHVTQYVYDTLGQQIELEYFSSVSQANAGTPQYTITSTYDSRVCWHQSSIHVRAQRPFSTT